MLQKLLEARLSKAVQKQVLAGVGTVPKNDADYILTRVAQLDASKLRGIIVIAALDLEDPVRGNGVDFDVDVQTLVAGTPATLDPLLELASFQIDERLNSKPEGEVCPDCDEVHEGGEDFLEQLLRRGPGGGLKASPRMHDYVNQMLDRPPGDKEQNEMLEALVLAMTLGPLMRKR